ncbi:MAG: type 2 isopentenyl-diphosphate Delta-isomerase [Bacteriodetes bacterium]|nr:type 2 isopentenyl-diphosphate Delta-isomerase [Bacteroidota bacterium]
MNPEQSNSTVSRKQQHVELCLERDVTFRTKTAGFENFDFAYNALPEMNLEDANASTMFLGKHLRIPLMVSSMTGGYPDAERINAQLAELCQTYRLAMGVGSMRQALESTTHHSTFSVTRTYAPDIPICANIGAAEIAVMNDYKQLYTLIDLIRADALIIHLNPLQELLQPEGTPKYRGVLQGIERTVKELDIPVIVKEVGAGISASVAQRLLDVGVRIIDVAGAGGTSWAGVEILRNTKREAFAEFWDIGIPTAQCLLQVRELKKKTPFTLIASGGITNGVEMAKALGLGADLCGIARPLLQVLLNEGQHAAEKKILDWELQLRSVMFVTGVPTIQELHVALTPANTAKNKTTTTDIYGVY